ncbi:tRNA (guanine(26)-N(2))-dimethyltransferase [Mycena kentingensis (nom. inval.)]|nr:tRNA (guanine(26)-N(2))-dimethyltransferase [Mycena kentingensis (nom. inval.)]
MSKISIPEIPEGFSLHTENTSHILRASNEAFLNPIQEFNRDLTIACIKTWSDMLHESSKARWIASQERKANGNARGKGKGKKKQQQQQNPLEEDLEQPKKKIKLDTEAAPGEDLEQPKQKVELDSEATPAPKLRHSFSRRPIVILEPLSATGLRAIRFAKEIPHVLRVIANDLSPAAAAAIRRNIELNKLDLPPPELGPRPVEVKVVEGDACTLMYNHREAANRVDVIDLDPYGTAAPFIDAAVQAVRDNGILCITCTDLAVLATVNFPEKCFSNYGGVSTKSEYSHEVALRLVLHTVSTSAARYGRFIEPLLSLSIDFYVRLFIRVKSSPIDVKRAVAKTSIFWICNDCQSHYGQTIGHVNEKKVDAHGAVNFVFKTQAGPPVSENCPECKGVLHAAGPMWSAPLHNQEFVSNVLKHVENTEAEKAYGTVARMKGMLTVAKDEIPAPFYFTPAKIAKLFHCVTPSFSDVASALLHAGFQVERSHAAPGSIKTNATRGELLDIYRCWVKANPVKDSAPTTPGARLLSKEPNLEANFTRHPQISRYTSGPKLVRYQEPPPNWGPGTRATGPAKSAPAKRKHIKIEDLEEQED